MNTITMARPVPAVIPAVGNWRPAPQMAPAFHAPAPGQARWRPQLSQQAISIAKGADVLFSLLTGVGALTVGIAAMTVGIGGEIGTGTDKTKPSSTWKWIGGFTALAGTLLILTNVLELGKISKSGPMAPVTATPTAQPQS